RRRAARPQRRELVEPAGGDDPDVLRDGARKRGLRGRAVGGRAELRAADAGGRGATGEHAVPDAGGGAARHLRRGRHLRGGALPARALLGRLFPAARGSTAEGGGGPGGGAGGGGDVRGGPPPRPQRG